jgi:hypothetical protein
VSDELEARLRRAEDILEIQQLFIDYGALLDAGRFEEYSTLFARDGELDLGPIGRATGPDAIRKMMEENVGSSAMGSVHLISSPRIELDGDIASSEVMWTVINQGDDGRPVVGMVGLHRDRLVREDGRWRFAKRVGLMTLPAVYPGS